MLLNILTATIPDVQGRDPLGFSRNTLELSCSHQLAQPNWSHKKFVAHTTNMPAQQKCKPMAMLCMRAQFHSFLCTLSSMLHWAFPNQLCRSSMLPADRVKEWDMAENLSHSSIAHQQHTAAECSRNAHPSVCWAPPVAWLGKLHWLEQRQWRYPACSSSPWDLQTGLQPPTYCKTCKTLMASPHTTFTGLWAVKL